MENDKKYTVIELAELIGVPRTTINDWLGRYSIYIDSAAQGKRRVYSDSSVAVLKEIAELRNAGKAFSDIETELSRRHPVRGVPEPETSPADKAAPGSEVPAAQSVPRGGEEFSLIAKQQSDELGKIIGESFQSMARRMEELEKISRRQSRMSTLWLGLALLFLLCLVSSGALYYRMYAETRRENAALLLKQSGDAAKIAALREESVSLVAGSRVFQSNIQRLEKELKDQRTAFDKGILEARKALEDARNTELAAERKRAAELLQSQESRFAAEREKAAAVIRERETRIALEKEKFAAERLTLLHEMEKLKQEQGKKASVPAKAPVPAAPVPVPVKVIMEEKVSPAPKAAPSVPVSAKETVPEKKKEEKVLSSGGTK